MLPTKSLTKLWPTYSPLYSYDAAEDNEITFREGEVITEIEPASEDWWQGKNPRGEVGLFPGKRHLIS